MEYSLSTLEITLFILLVICISIIWSQNKMLKSLVDNKNCEQTKKQINPNDIRSL